MPEFIGRADVAWQAARTRDDRNGLCVIIGRRARGRKRGMMRIAQLAAMECRQLRRTRVIKDQGIRERRIPGFFQQVNQLNRVQRGQPLFDQAAVRRKRVNRHIQHLRGQLQNQSGLTGRFHAGIAFLSVRRLGLRDAAQLFHIHFIVSRERNRVQHDPNLRRHIVRQQLFNMDAEFFFQPRIRLIGMGGYKADHPGAGAGNMHRHGTLNLTELLRAIFNFRQFDTVPPHFHLRIFTPDDFYFSIRQISAQIAGFIQPPIALGVNKFLTG
ncbi:Uncharacterised protein [Serratia entomophila]|nr:Uncharacterised protein [Serratia entomophila]